MRRQVEPHDSLVLWSRVAITVAAGLRASGRGRIATGSILTNARDTWVFIVSVGM
jgi:hypothetical protein